MELGKGVFTSRIRIKWWNCRKDQDKMSELDELELVLTHRIRIKRRNFAKGVLTYRIRIEW